MKDLNADSISNSVENVLLPTIGWAGSGAVVALVPEKQQKIVKGAMLGASILVAAATQAGSRVMKSSTKVLSGIAIRQGVELLQDALRSKYTITDASPASDKMIAGAIGLACPDGSCQSDYALTYDMHDAQPLHLDEYQDDYDTVYNELEQDQMHYTPIVPTNNSFI